MSVVFGTLLLSGPYPEHLLLLLLILAAPVVIVAAAVKLVREIREGREIAAREEEEKRG